uniref:Bm9497 n=1 Tax=Brugia malayi TaxID=6279 RepID=A0A0I9N8Z3_BRUMA|nr:Bm9497 [Brugia malayi]
MYDVFNNSDEANSLYLGEDDDAIGGNMILQGMVKMPIPITTTVAPTGKPEVILALTIVLVVLVIFLIISIFLLLYCVLKRQGGKIERKRVEQEKRRATGIEAAVRSAESTLKTPKQSTQVPSPTPFPIALPRAKSISKKLAVPLTQSETAVEAPPLFINQIFVSRWPDPWQQVNHEPSDFSFELESDSVNDICLQPL